MSVGSTADPDVKSGQTEDPKPSGFFRRMREDLRILWHLVAHPVRGKDHKQRLDSFYGGQVGDYDKFRERMLHGRKELFAEVPVVEGGHWVDLGCGTGRNVLFLAERGDGFSHIDLVDLSSTMIEHATKRFEEDSRIQCHERDATRTELPAGSADLVTFSYSLTMIPDWFAAIEEAKRLLKPGGTLAVVDFFVSRKYPAGDARQKHGWFTRSFWPVWFASDNVFLSSDHLAMLERSFETVSLAECKGSIPYIPLLRVPHYRWIGRKRD